MKQIYMINETDELFIYNLIWLISRIKKINKREKYGDEGFILFLCSGVLLSFIVSLILLTNNIQEFVKIKLAPRVFVIDKIKGDK